jgi:hypothetical protein
MVEANLNEARTSGRKRISLVALINLCDYRHRMGVVLDELNAALSGIDWLVAEREGTELFLRFTSRPVKTHVVVSEEDFRWADQGFRRMFEKA